MTFGAIHFPSAALSTAYFSSIHLQFNSTIRHWPAIKVTPVGTPTRVYRHPSFYKLQQNKRIFSTWFLQTIKHFIKYILLFSMACFHHHPTATGNRQQLSKSYPFLLPILYNRLKKKRNENHLVVRTDFIYPTYTNHVEIKS